MSCADTTVNRAALTASINRQNAYSPLLRGTQTRIVHFQRGSPHALFEAFLEVIDLDLSNAPSYSAISYCCGDQSPVSDVYFAHNDTHFGIGQNLTDALTRVLHDGIPGPFWIDAISINQDDEEEKNQQVRMMTRIFTAAKQVLMWLGRDDGSLRRAVMLLLKWSDPFNNQDRTDETFLQISNRHRSFDAADYEQMRPLFEAMSEQDWTILRAFFDRPYWRRSWIVQEVTCARKLQVLCDTVPTFAFEVLMMAPSFLQYHAQFRLLEVGEDQGLRTSVVQSIRLSNLLNLRTAWQRQGAVHMSRMFKAYSYESSNPRDRFFATQGIFDIPPDVKHHFIIDYGQPVWYVYAEAVRGIIKATKSLLVLTVSNHRLPVDQSFPSWVPRFDGRADHVGWDPDNDAWTYDTAIANDTPHAVPATEPHLREVNDTQTLSLLGIKYAHTIAMTFSLCPQGWWQGEPDDGPRIWKWFKWPAANSYMSLHKLPIWQDKRAMAMAFAECTTARYRCAPALRQHPNNKLLVFADFRAYLHAWVDTVLSEDVTKAMHPQAAELKADLVAWDAEDAVGTAVASTNGLSEEAATQETNPKADVSRYYRAMVLQCSEKSLIITRDWKIGVGPLKAQKDDSVVVFFGAARPFVIRQQKQSEKPPDLQTTSMDKRREKWQLIGHGWLQGLMSGEALDGPGEKGEWFDLV